MPVNPSSPRKVLVVHGVQSSDTNLNQDTLINELIRARIENIPLSYACELYRYENLNVDALPPTGTARSSAINSSTC